MALQRFLQFFDELVLCVQIRIGVYEWFQALIVLVKRLMYVSASRLKRIRVGNNYGWLAPKLLTENFRCFSKDFASDFQRACVFGRRQSLGQRGPFRG